MTGTPLLDRYLSTFNPMRAGKLRVTLLKVQGFSGSYMPRHTWAEKMFDVPGVEVDYSKSPIRLYNGDEQTTWYDVGDIPKALADYVVWLQDASKKQGD
jgi:hypothetical protein